MSLLGTRSGKENVSGVRLVMKSSFGSLDSMKSLFLIIGVTSHDVHARIEISVTIGFFGGNGVFNFM